MAENRLNRELDTREKTARKKSWTRPETLPTPFKEDGYEFHWVRISTRGESDAMNVSLKLQEGWEPVKAAEHPEIFVGRIEDERFKENIVIGGLLLCKTPVEIVDERNAWFQNQATNQMHSVDNNLMRENDPRMPLYNDRKTSVSFGKGV
jgi:hypothetical protein